MGTLTHLENVAMLNMNAELIHQESSTAVIVMKLHAVILIGNGVTVTLFIA